jgi:hypothetical protein
MNLLSIIGLVVMLSGFLCCVVAGALYEPPMQRYLEKFGRAPAFFLFSWSGVQDYFSARQVARQWGHNPSFLRRYGRMVAVGLALFVVGALVVGLGQLL